MLLFTPFPHTHTHTHTIPANPALWSAEPKLYHVQNNNMRAIGKERVPIQSQKRLNSSTNDASNNTVADSDPSLNMKLNYLCLFVTTS